MVTAFKCVCVFIRVEDKGAGAKATDEVAIEEARRIREERMIVLDIVEDVGTDVGCTLAWRCFCCLCCCSRLK